jgi:hypothetical protein
MQLLISPVPACSVNLSIRVNRQGLSGPDSDDLPGRSVGASFSRNARVLRPVRFREARPGSTRNASRSRPAIPLFQHALTCAIMLGLSAAGPRTRIRSRGPIRAAGAAFAPDSPGHPQAISVSGPSGLPGRARAGIRSRGHGVSAGWRPASGCIPAEDAPPGRLRRGCQDCLMGIRASGSWHPTSGIPEASLRHPSRPSCILDGSSGIPAASLPPVLPASLMGHPASLLWHCGFPRRRPRILAEASRRRCGKAGPPGTSSRRSRHPGPPLLQTSSARLRPGRMSSHPPGRGGCRAPGNGIREGRGRVAGLPAEAGYHGRCATSEGSRSF